MNVNVVMLILAATFLSVSAVGQATLSGRLLLSNGKPRQYTEIELVPTSAKAMFDDPRLNAISDTSGRFQFRDVPRGKYHLSINFGERPSELSPFDTYFYPGTEIRDDAQIFELKADSKVEGLVFKLLPALILQKISGKIVDLDGKPVAGARIGLRDLKLGRGSSFTDGLSAKNGDFVVRAFIGRRYQLAAIMFNDPGNRPLDVLDFLGAAESEPFVVGKTPMIMSLTLKPDPNVEMLRERYNGWLLPEIRINDRNLRINNGE